MKNFNNDNTFKYNYYQYFNKKKKWLFNNANIWFNKTCLQLNLTPKFATIKNKPYSTPARITNWQYSKLRLRNEIKYLYTKKQYLSLQLYEQELYNSTYFGKFWHNIKQCMLENFYQSSLKRNMTY